MEKEEECRSFPSRSVDPTFVSGDDENEKEGERCPSFRSVGRTFVSREKNKEEIDQEENEEGWG